MEKKEILEKLVKIPYGKGLDEILPNIKKIINKFDAKAEPYKKSGYIFYDKNKRFFNSARKIKTDNKKGAYEGEDFDHVLHRLSKDLRLGYRLNKILKQDAQNKGVSLNEYINKHLSEKDKITMKEIRNNQKRAKQILQMEYKIHLMPKKEYMLPIIEKILSACQKDPELRELISDFKFLEKIKDPHGLARDSIYANIVLYPKLGKANFELLMKKLLDIFANFELKEIGMDVVPRFSKAQNALITYAQGGGDLKIEVLHESIDESEEFLTKHKVHFAWSRPPKFLNTPLLPPKEYKQSLDSEDEIPPAVIAPDAHLRPKMQLTSDKLKAYNKEIMDKAKSHLKKK